MNAENLSEHGFDFYFPDETSEDYIGEVVCRIVGDFHAGVDGKSLIIDEMGGTTYFAYFDAEQRVLPRSFFDLDDDGKETRVLALFHLTSRVDE